MTTMKAAVIYKADRREVQKIESRAISTLHNGEVLVHIKAFGHNRFKLFIGQVTFRSSPRSCVPRADSGPEHNDAIRDSPASIVSHR